MFWVSVDGLDGSGKTHSIQFIKDRLEERGYKVILLRAMGSGKMGEVVREELIHGRIKKNAEALFAIAAHLDHYNEASKHLKKKNTVVISDRSLASFYAYQYTANAAIASDIIIKHLVKDFLFTNKPTHSILIDVKPEIAKARTNSRPNQNSIDKKDIEFYKKVAEGYRIYFSANAIYQYNHNATKDISIITNNHSLTNFEKKLNSYISKHF